MIPDQIVRPTFISSTIASSQPLRNANNKGSHNNIRHKTTRVQDSGLSEMTDEGTQDCAFRYHLYIHLNSRFEQIFSNHVHR